MNRRHFLKSSAALGAASRFGTALRAPNEQPRKTLLVLGGTGFIGPHLVRLASARGHAVTIFTRGQREADLPSSVERLIGDRNGKLDALRGRRWDAVIDDSATNPDWVRQSSALLKGATQRYLFTSSTGVYYPYLQKGLNEADGVHTDAVDAKDGSESFGTRKAQCEALVRAEFGERGLVVRPTYIVGPGDYTDRFTYWPVRLAEGGDVLAPGLKEDRVQWIDVRDLAAFMVGLVEREASGVFNAIGPRSALGIAAFLEHSMRALSSQARLTWVDDYLLLEKHGIEGMVPWILPKGNNVGHTSITSTRSWDHGLTLRPLAETVRDTLSWFNALSAERRGGAKWVLSRTKEAEILQVWRERRGGA